MMAEDWRPRLRLLEATGSTNDDVKVAAEAGEAEGLVIQARRQTAGRGRQGRSWESPGGNLYLSVLLRPRIPVTAIPHYGFLAGLAVHETVRFYLPGRSVRLKWPNDVLVERKKISGLLLEAAPADAGGKVPWLVAGVGINVAFHPFDLPYPATSLAAEGGGVSADQVRETLLAALGRWRQLYREEGFEPVRAAWEGAALTGLLTVRTGGAPLEGDFMGLEPDGRLRLRLADGAEKVIAAGDVLPVS